LSFLPLFIWIVQLFERALSSEMELMECYKFVCGIMLCSLVLRYTVGFEFKLDMEFEVDFLFYF
jgi:hypothetical protein